jgi:hypothetical protein
MMTELFALPRGHLMSSTAAGRCPNESHCWHEGTGLGSYFCCKCGATKYEPLIYSSFFSGGNGGNNSH